MSFVPGPYSGISLPAEIKRIPFSGETISRRGKRMPDHRIENDALLQLLDACANAPCTIPRVLVDAALTACDADSAVLGILETDPVPVFRWIAVAGALSGFEGLAIARHETPSGMILERNCPQLLRYPRQTFAGLPKEPTIVEALYAPFKVQDRTVGSLWVASHSEERHFDEECVRILEQLARFAGIAQRLHESNEALRKTEHALKDADRRKDAFLAVLAHELRNPLAPIRNAAHVLNSPHLRGMDLRWAQAVITRQVAQMSHLLDDLLDISRITQNRIRLNIEAVALTSVIDSAVEAARPTIDGKHHRLSIGIPPEPVSLPADSVRLTQVITNLLTNAAKYTDPGGGIDLTAQVVESDLVLRVRDTGVGIAPDALGTLFQIFSQVEDTLNRADGGLGIGLALTKGFVELHGGTIEAHSEGPGRGSEFVVRIPMRNLDGTPGTAAPETTSQPALARARVLIADDNKDAADTLAILLELAGHEVRVASSGQAALSLAQAFRPEVAVIDIGMPDMDGYAVAESLRQAPWSPHLALIALTGWGQDADRDRAHAAGFDHHLTKPADPECIDALIGELTRKYRGG